MQTMSKQGTLFFDSVGNFPKLYRNPTSIIANAPQRILKGHISDPAELISVMEQESASQADLGYPQGGLAGWIDYAGNYTFGLYPKFWVYSHVSEQWLQHGVRTFEKERVRGEQKLSNWQAQTTRAEYLTAVQQAQEYIAAGEIYQVNLAQKFKAQVEGGGDLYDIYQELRHASPAPMACYGNLDGVELLCSSPETFLRMSGQVVETRPIKGTSPRFADSESDNLSAYELMTSEKEKAELLMITDLLRNDLGQVCEYGSVKVDELLSVEQLQHVYHMVSTVRGQLRPEISQVDTLRACLPGGSITGAPKIRAMQVIEELEKTPRGLYTGVVGYLGFNGESQFNIIIRSLVRQQNDIHYHVGAGIVADSQAELEYEETLIKAEGIRNALDKFK